jgi:hypothetical protein
MGFGRRTDVAEGKKLFVFMDFGRRDLAGGDLAEEAIRVVTHRIPDAVGLKREAWLDAAERLCAGAA